MFNVALTNEGDKKEEKILIGDLKGEVASKSPNIYRTSYPFYTFNKSIRVYLNWNLLYSYHLISSSFISDACITTGYQMIKYPELFEKY